MPRLLDLAKVATATTGTGTITLGAASAGFSTFANAGAADQDVIWYGIQDGSNSEVGYGTYTAAGTTLTRNVVRSTNSNAALSLSGSATVFSVGPAEAFQSSHSIKSANYTITASDQGSAIDFTGSITLSMSTALPNGFWCEIRNSNALAGVGTLSPPSGTIDTQTSISVYPGEAFTVGWDGMNAFTSGRSKFVLLNGMDLSGGGGTAAFYDLTAGCADVEITAIEACIDYVQLSGPDQLAVQFNGQTSAIYFDEQTRATTSTTASTGTGSTGITYIHLETSAHLDGRSCTFTVIKLPSAQPLRLRGRSERYASTGVVNSIVAGVGGSGPLTIMRVLTIGGATIINGNFRFYGRR